MKRQSIKWIVFFTLSIFPLTFITSFGNVPNVSASSAIVMDVQTGRILYQKNVHDKKPMASTTKIMTALLALEKSKLDAVVKIPREAVGVEGSSIYLGYDEKVKMRDLLYGLMLRSGNDSAVAIATYVAGSVENFTELMNKKAKEVGANNTHFVNPHGLHHKEHYTTAYDLALITRAALKNETFKNIVRTKLWIAERDGYKYFFNKNKALVELEGGDGVKTGYTKAAGRCLVTSATRNNMQLICVVLNAPNWFQDSYNLLNYAFDKYNACPIIKKDTVLKRMIVKNGEKTSTGIVALENVTLPLTDEEERKVLTVLELDDTLIAPVSRGQKVGKAKLYLNSKLLYVTDLICREDIGIKSFTSKITDFIHNKIN